MRKRIGTKHYDTEKATLVDTLPDGIQVYRKTGRSTECYYYNPNGNTAREKFIDLSEEEAEKYMPEVNYSYASTNSGNTVRFRPYDFQRIKRYAKESNMAMNNFLIMLVDEYEQRPK